jgi:hypothetical protein
VRPSYFAFVNNILAVNVPFELNLQNAVSQSFFIIFKCGRATASARFHLFLFVTTSEWAKAMDGGLKNKNESRQETRKSVKPCVQNYYGEINDQDVQNA